MPYVEATILELLRYKTPFPFVLRSIRLDTEVGGYAIPRGTLVRFIVFVRDASCAVCSVWLRC